ncbi:MAG: chorismate mutase [Firmicutes bacterium]|nr:chorismate mutase [Bacillota bacterium]
MSLDELRIQIDEIDQKMMRLFKDRMTVSQMIGDYKKINHLPVLDQNREKELLNKRKEQLNDDQLWPLYESFIKEVMKLSKAYQK